MRFKKLAIIGVGLIGGSIGLAARQRGLAAEITGVCRHLQSLRKAKEIGAIDQGTLNYRQAVTGADLVILTTPISSVVKIIKLIIPFLNKGCLITDAASTKVQIVTQVEGVLPDDLYFVGAHPLAGSERKGVEFSCADLFKGTTCILTPTKQTNPLALQRVAAFWERIGCRNKVLSAQRHDQIVALISHLPHLAATQLVKVAKNSLDFAASGFFDTTRIASSGAEIWSDICLSNKKYIMQAIDEYISRLQLVKKLIAGEDRKKISAEFKSAKALRDALQKQK